MQKNWIGRSTGCELEFEVKNSDTKLIAYTTRPDTIYGVTYLVLAPEHDLVPSLTTSEQKEAVEEYVKTALNKSDRDRQIDAKEASGVFTGSYVINPFNGEEVPLWIADYVLADYGTGVVMAVPSSDDRDFRFAKKFDLPIVRVIAGTEQLEDPTEIKHGTLINSGFLDGMDTKDGIQKAIEHAEKEGFGIPKVNFKIRDAVFSRQRYWGEPVPVYFEEDKPILLPESELPLVLPEVDAYLPTEDGEPPLARAENWKYQDQFPYEKTTMPGWAGSNWYFLRYMDPQNKESFAERKAVDYWNIVDLYIGGSEHATGHLLYSRFWNLFLYDIGAIGHEEPFQRLVNQGMIQGRSSLAHRLKEDPNTFVSLHKIGNRETTTLHVPVNLVDAHDRLDLDAFRKWRKDLAEASFETEADGHFVCDFAIEKMSKSKFNVINPDEVIEKYSADTLRLYEMFLGPLEASKPWNTHGIDGTAKFLRKLWNLFYNDKGLKITQDKPSKAALKTLHKTIRKVSEDIETLSLNTSVSAFMVCVNELNAEKCTSVDVLKPLLIILSPFAPHIAEELWTAIGHDQSISQEEWPDFDESYLKEDSVMYPISINGKVRVKLEASTEASKDDVEQLALSNPVVQKWLDGKTPTKVIVVPGRIVNIVLK
jgi:leucyl-tRNA synthetase